MSLLCRNARRRRSPMPAFLDTPQSTPASPSSAAHNLLGGLHQPIPGVCNTKFRPTYQVAPVVSLPGIVADLEDAYDEDEDGENGTSRLVVSGNGLDVRDRLGLFVMVCSALVGVQAMLPKGL